jgi:hypothetical protein
MAGVFLTWASASSASIHLCAFLDNALASPDADNPSVLEAVLEVADSTITYRGRYNLLPNLATVYDLVLLDDTNPRSLLFQLNQLVKHFERLPGERESALPSPGQRILLECLTSLRLLDPRELNQLKGGWQESETWAGHSANPAPDAAPVRRHCGQLLRPFRHLPRRRQRRLVI